MKMFKILLLVLTLSMMKTSQAYQTSEMEKVDTEVIEVIGKFSKVQLESIAEQARYNYFQTFNKYNDIEKFRVICRARASIGSHIKQMECEPQYLKMKRREYISKVFGMPGQVNLSRYPSESKIAWAVQQDDQDAKAHALDLANKHPELMESMHMMAKAQRAYEIRKELGN